MIELNGFVSNKDAENMLVQATNEELLCITRSLDMDSYDAFPCRSKEIFEKLQNTAAHSFGNILKKNGGIPYWNIVHNVSKKLETHSSGRESSWAQKNYRVLENQIFEVVFQTYLSSLDENQRKNLEDELDSLAWQLGENYSNMGGGIFALAAASIGGTSLVAAFTSSVGLVVGPIGWLALGVLAAYKFGAPNYQKILPCITVISSIRQRLELKNKDGLNDSFWQDQVANIQVKNGF